MAAALPALELLCAVVDRFDDPAESVDDGTRTWARTVCDQTLKCLATAGLKPQSLSEYATHTSWLSADRGANGPRLREPWPDPSRVSTVVSTPAGSVRCVDLVNLTITLLVSELLTYDASIPPRALATAARTLSNVAASRFPGKTIELRVPPVAAVQLGFGRGPVHTRGTPPNVIETDPHTFIRLGTGLMTWHEALTQHHATASGDAADLSPALPLVLSRRG